MTRIKYFAYGSNLSLDQMKKRCPGHKLIGRARLAGYRIGFTFYSPGWNCGTADIIKDESAEVWGLLYTITVKDLKSLDDYEGVPTAYRRLRVTVEAESGPVEDVVTYEVVTKQDFVRPSFEYMSIILSAARAYGFPDSYLNRLRVT